MRSVDKIKSELAAAKKRLATAQDESVKLQQKIAALENAYKIACGDSDEKEVERVDGELQASLASQRKLAFRVEGITDKIAELENDVKRTEAKVAEAQTAKLVAKNDEVVARVKNSIRALAKDAADLEEIWRQLGYVAGSPRSASSAVATALALALHPTLPDLRQLVIMHPERNSGTAGLDTFSHMFTARATRATAVQP